MAATFMQLHRATKSLVKILSAFDRDDRTRVLDAAQAILNGKEKEQ